MKRSIINNGLDVDETQYHGSALSKTTVEVLDFKCRPTLNGLVISSYTNLITVLNHLVRDTAINLKGGTMRVKYPFLRFSGIRAQIRIAGIT